MQKLRHLFSKSATRTVLALGVVSFFTDCSSEMIYPLLPLFLTQVLGATPAALGLIEGLAESTSAFLKILSGLWTDRVGRRKPFVFVGYLLAGVARPLVGLAASWPVVIGIRFVDRLGKGLRSAPRDALIADVAEEHERGRLYGLHRSMDHAGAVVGPLVASALLAWGLGLREVFLWAALPAFLALLILWFFVHEPPRSEHQLRGPSLSDLVARQQREAPPQISPRVSESSAPDSNPEILIESAPPTARAEALHLRADWAQLTPRFRWFLLILLVFQLGNATDAFLLLKLTDSGLAAEAVGAVWALHHVVKMLATYWGGRWVDRLGRKSSLLLAWVLYAMTYGLFQFPLGASAAVAVFLFYGLHFGLLEPAERALVADMAPPQLRGTAFGFFHMVIGLAALPASVLFGWLWQSFGPARAFLVGASLAFAAALLLLVLLRHPKSSLMIRK